jgi:hypothetical protein
MLPAAPATPGPPVPPRADARFDVLRSRRPGQGVQAGSPADAEAAARRRAGLSVPPAVTAEPDAVRGPTQLAATDLVDEMDYATAVIALGAGLAHLNERQHQRLVGDAIAFIWPSDKTDAIAGLGAGLAHLTEPRRASLVSAAIGLDDRWHRARAIAGLSKGLAHLSDSQGAQWAG